MHPHVAIAAQYETHAVGGQRNAVVLLARHEHWGHDHELPATKAPVPSAACVQGNTTV
jgi:hypothetical protein